MEWITVDERLPVVERDNEYSDYVLITTGEDEGGYNQVKIGYIEQYADGEYIWFDTDGNHARVIAWMPLPEPYCPG